MIFQTFLYSFFVILLFGAKDGPKVGSGTADAEIKDPQPSGILPRRELEAEKRVGILPRPESEAEGCVGLLLPGRVSETEGRNIKTRSTGEAEERRRFFFSNMTKRELYFRDLFLDAQAIKVGGR